MTTTAAPPREDAKYVAATAAVADREVMAAVDGGDGVRHEANERERERERRGK